MRPLHSSTARPHRHHKVRFAGMPRSSRLVRMSQRLKARSHVLAAALNRAAAWCERRRPARPATEASIWTTAPRIYEQRAWRSDAGCDITGFEIHVRFRADPQWWYTWGPPSTHACSPTLSSPRNADIWFVSISFSWLFNTQMRYLICFHYI